MSSIFSHLATTLFGNPSSQQQQSQSTSSGLNLSSSLSNEASQSASQGTSFGASNQTVLGPQLDALLKLYSGAEGATAQAAGMVPALQGQAAQLFTGGAGFLDNLMGAGSNGAVSAQEQALQTQLGQQFQSELGGIRNSGVAAGTLGGGREGVAEGLAMQGSQNALASGVAQILGQQRTSQIDAASAGLGALPGLANVAGTGLNATLAPYATLAQIIGSPTVLASSEQGSQNTATSLAQALSSSLGYGTQTAQSTSSGSSSGADPGLLGRLIGIVGAVRGGSGSTGVPT